MTSKTAATQALPSILFFSDPQKKENKCHHTFGTLPFARNTNYRSAKVKEPNLANLFLFVCN